MTSESGERGQKAMGQKKDRPKKAPDVATILLTALMDLLVGIALLFVSKL